MGYFSAQDSGAIAGPPSPPLQSEGACAANAEANVTSLQQDDGYLDRISSLDRTPFMDSQIRNPAGTMHRTSLQKQTSATIASEERAEEGRSLESKGVNHRADPRGPGATLFTSSLLTSHDTSTQARDCPVPSNQALPGQSHGPKSLPIQNRGNISLLSAPTRPRGGPRFRDTSWSGASPARRTPIPTAPLGPTAIPRGNTTPSSSVNEIHRSHKQHSITPAANAPGQKLTSYLAGLSTVLPGGRTLTFSLDPAIKRRISQLEVDEGKLLEQHAERQRLKRLWIKDWGQVDRESSISNLRSELAEGQLHQLAEGDDVHRSAVF